MIQNGLGLPLIALQRISAVKENDQAADEREQSPEVNQKAGDGSGVSLPEQIESLSEREMEILCLLRSRLMVPEMVELLSVAERTVRSHIKNVYNKLAVHRRLDAIQRAVELGWLAKTPSSTPS